MRRQIRQAIAARIAAWPGIAGVVSVSDSRHLSLELASLPRILIATDGDEVVDGESGPRSVAPPVYRLRTTVAVAIVLEWTPANADTLSADLDDLAELVEAALRTAPGDYLEPELADGRNLVQAFRYTGTDLARSGEGTTGTGSAVLRYVVDYFTEHGTETGAALAGVDIDYHREAPGTYPEEGPHAEDTLDAPTP